VLEEQAIFCSSWDSLQCYGCLRNSLALLSL
jgi:hypothetical protein